MRILLAAKYLHFPQGAGGLERNTHELCLHLIRRGLSPAVMCDLEYDRSLLSFRNILARKLRPSIRFPMDSQLGYPVFRGWSNEDGAHEVVTRFKPDVVIAQSAEPVPLLESFRGLEVPLMAYFHEVERVWDAATLAGWGNVGLLANSEFTARKMAERSGIQPAVIRPLIDRSHYVTAMAPKNALFINTQPRKGVEIAFRLAESRPDVHFDIVKSWCLSPTDLQKLVDRAAAAGNITLHAPTNDMRRLYKRARLLLAPSQWEEAWGRVATEAHINGIPVLASDRGGLPESVGPGGILVAHGAPIAQWLEAFAKIWDDDAAYARYSAAALAHSRRPDIQPEAIVTEFIGQVTEFIDRHRTGALAPRLSATPGAPEVISAARAVSEPG